jgi:glucokinase
MKENTANVNLMLLAGDIGGTSTRLGIFEAGRPRPRELTTRILTTLDFNGLPSMITSFLAAEAINPASITSACFGVAGPVIGQTAMLTNVPWSIDGGQVATAFGLGPVTLLNDLQAMAYAVPVLSDTELHTLQHGEPVLGGNIGLIAAGTGLGVSLLHTVDGRFIPSPSESGHADYAPRTERDIGLLRHLTSRYGRAEVEHVVSGRGLVNIHRFAHTATCAAAVDLESPGAPAAISTAGLERRCPGCVEALDIFVEAYGAEAGNLALRSVATAGVYVGGGVAPKILPALVSGAFMAAFLAKGTFESMLRRMPVNVILNAEAGLLGAAVFAAGV